MDASVAVSAALNPDGIPRRALLAARRHGTIALSDPVFQKISDVLSRPRLRRFLPRGAAAEVTGLLADAAIWAMGTWAPVTDCRDAKNNIYLELALATSASAIVTGDDDLLSLDAWRSVRILKPANFLSYLQGVDPIDANQS